jgi:PAS domain S-box-containing protein
MIHDAKTGRPLEVNARMVELLGYGREELLRMQVEDWTAGDPTAMRRKAMRRIREASRGRPQLFEWRVTRKDGRPIWVEVNLKRAVIRGQSCVLAVVRDITKRKRNEEKLRASEERFRAMFELSPYSIVLTDLEGAILACNTQFAQLHTTEKGPAAQVGKHVSEFCVRKELPRLRDHIRKTIEERWHAITVEYTMLREDGTVFPAEATSKVVLDEQGQPTAIIAMGHDITERRNAERERLAYQRKLRSLASELSLAEERERRRIAAGLHDHVCQTLALSKIELGRLRESLPRRDAPEIEGVCGTLDGILQSVRDLVFDLSSPTLYRFGLEASLEELLHDKLRSQRGLHATFYDDGAPKPLAEDVRILLFQSVRELLINIIKYARAHEVNLDITRLDDTVRITITDDGVGFDIEDVLSAPSRSRGFGLFNIQERLDYIGGRFEMSSEPGQGSRFTLIAHLETPPDTVEKPPDLHRHSTG